jgi:hypothetical protein
MATKFCEYEGCEQTASNRILIRRKRDWKTHLDTFVCEKHSFEVQRPFSTACGLHPHLTFERVYRGVDGFNA